MDLQSVFDLTFNKPAEFSSHQKTSAVKVAIVGIALWHVNL